MHVKIFVMTYIKIQTDMNDVKRHDAYSYHNACICHNTCTVTYLYIYMYESQPMYIHHLVCIILYIVYHYICTRISHERLWYMNMSVIAISIYYSTSIRVPQCIYIPYMHISRYILRISSIITYVITPTTT